MNLTPAQRAYVTLYGARQRKANRAATIAANKWEIRKAYLTARAIATGWDLDGKTFRDFCKLDYGLNDAMDAWSWNEREAKRCADAIDGLYKEILLLGNTSERVMEEVPA
jgi:hypothetical protein